MRNTFFKREPVLTKTTQTRLLKTGLKQFGSIIFDIPASNAGHEVRIWSETAKFTKTKYRFRTTNMCEKRSVTPQTTSVCVFQKFQVFPSQFSYPADTRKWNHAILRRFLLGHISAPECCKSACISKYCVFGAKPRVRSVWKRSVGVAFASGSPTNSPGLRKTAETTKYRDIYTVWDLDVEHPIF